MNEKSFSVSSFNGVEMVVQNSIFKSTAYFISNSGELCSQLSLYSDYSLLKGIACVQN